MAREFTLEKFQGPLDLLLSLIDDAKLAITDVSIGIVTEQFFAHLETLGDTREDELADFLVIGTKLVYLKSKELLPYLQPDEADGPSLATQLKMYKRYADASKHVERQWSRGLTGYGRVTPLIRPEGFFPPENVALDSLHRSFVALLKRLTPVAPLPQVKIDRTISVKQKVAALSDALKQFKKLRFRDMLSGATNRTEVIVTFLAILELVKQSEASVAQPDAFGELEIQKL